MVADLLAQFESWSVLEVVAVAAAVAYLLLAVRQHIVCWLFAVISSLIYIELYFSAQLYMESVLSGFYLVMAVFGWWRWRTESPECEGLPVVRWSLQRHVFAIAGLSTVALSNGFLLDSYSQAAFPYIDSLTTWFAIWATFLVAQKVLENWWYWLVIDVVSIAIFWSRDLQLTALLFAVYVAIIPFGYHSWRKSMLAQAK